MPTITACTKDQPISDFTQKAVERHRLPVPRMIHQTKGNDNHQKIVTMLPNDSVFGTSKSSGGSNTDDEDDDSVAELRW